MTFTKATLRPAETPGAFILDNDGDEQLLFAEDLDHLRHLIDQVLDKPHVHNTDATDPDAHVIFDSVCCGAQLYRCDQGGDYSLANDTPLPSKPIIRQGEDACRSCGAPLAQF